jgi:hypothetical protein
VAEKAGGSAPAAKAQVAAPTVAPTSEAPATQGAVGGMSAGQTMLSVQIASGAADPPPQFRFTTAGLMALQRTVGNRAVAAAMARVQRVEVAYDEGETLYTGKTAEGKAKGEHFGGAGTFQLTRDADAAVNVEVRIRFLRQHRNTKPPRPGTKDPAVGELVKAQTELPEGDRSWATSISNAAVAKWNGKLTLVGVDKPAPDAAEVNKRIPVVFKATPKFGLTDEADTEVIVHPPNVTGGSKGNPIDAGNYYMKKDEKIYPATDAMIYAHEYGHLLGINDEYSQSNEQMNQLIHGAAPGTAASSVAALDKQTVELMVLATLTDPLTNQLQTSMGAVTSAIGAQKKAVKAKMIEAAKEGAQLAEVTDLLTSRLKAMSEAKLEETVPKAVAAQTTKNFASKTVATDGVDQVLSPWGLSNLIGDSYRKALMTPQRENFEVPGLGAVKINVKASIAKASSKRGALGTAAKGEAGEVVGKTGPGLPKLPPPDSLVGQLAAVPGTWTTAGGALESAINPTVFAQRMKATIEAATAAAVAAPPPGAAAAKPSVRTEKMLYGKAWVLVNNAALVGSTLDPVLNTSVTSLRTAIAAEVNKVMTMSPTELAANPSPDPKMTKIVTDMKSRLDAAKTALAGTSMDPLGVEGGSTPAQDVTYSYQGMMGSAKSTEIRADQFKLLIDNFNANLKKTTEQNFTAEVS